MGLLTYFYSFLFSNPLLAYGAVLLAPEVTSPIARSPRA
jgi:hypothetical protein